MEHKILIIDGCDFLVYFKKEHEKSWKGMAVQIQIFSSGEWMYQSKNSSDQTKDITEARVWFDWSFCWRGVWEGRVYFRDDEFWDEEMKTIYLLWEEIEKMMKEKIKSDNPDYEYFD
jgi:hypothetical protein